MRFGAGRISELASACAAIGIKRPLIVTDPGLAALPMIPVAVQILASEGLEGAVFSGLKSNPTGENVRAGSAVFRDNDHDGVIAMGGGSALDAGKAIALIARQNCPLWDLEDIGDNWLNADPTLIAPTLAVPTTAGTGSEVGRASVITDQSAGVKRIIFHPGIVPKIVIADPELTLGLPAHLTAATGMDALSHCLEAFCAPGYHPMARGIAVEGLRLIARWLPIAVRDGTDLEARGHMLAASSMGATAFQRGLGAMHALAHPLGAKFDAHHGLLNAILMPYVLQTNWAAIEVDLRYLGQCLGYGSAADVLDWVLDLRSSLGIPNSLAQIGISADRAVEIGAAAVADPSSGTNPLQLDASEYTALFERAVNGTL